MRPKSIVVRPVGDRWDSSLLARLAGDLGAIFATVARVSVQPFPEAGARNPVRNQTYAPLVLAALRAAGAPPGEVVLGVTESDLYADGLRFVFGQAEMPGQWGIISLSRLRGTPLEDAGERYYARAIKEAVHEIGHTLGLGHCANPTCVMRFSNNLTEADRKSVAFCSDCQAVATLESLAKG